MAVNFETANAALFTRLSDISGIQYSTRVLEDWDSSAPAKQPALMLTSGPISEFTASTAVNGMTPSLWRVQLLAVLYVQVPSKTTPPSTILNPLIAGVLNALNRTASETPSPAARFLPNPVGQFVTTLGGLCAYCRAFGTIERSEGLTGHVAAAAIPIEMVLTS